MTRYRSATTSPGVKPAAVPSVDTIRPIPLEEPEPEADPYAGAGRGPEGAFDARPVGICEIDESASPQDGQKRLPAGTEARQAGQMVDGEPRPDMGGC